MRVSDRGFDNPEEFISRPSTIAIYLTIIFAGIYFLLWIAQLFISSARQWDDDRLHRGLVVLAIVIAFQAWGMRFSGWKLKDDEDKSPLLPRQAVGLLPGGGLFPLLIGFLVILAWCQYTALGNGQPLIAIQHVIENLLKLLGMPDSDITAIRNVVDPMFAARHTFRQLPGNGFVVLDITLSVIAVAVVGGAAAATMSFQRMLAKRLKM